MCMGLADALKCPQSLFYQMSTQDLVLDPTGEFATLVELLRYRALHQPDRLAYTFLADDGSERLKLTYAELDRRVRAVAVLLRSKAPPGERVLLLYPPGLDYIVAFLGCLYAGMVAVPSYPPRLNRPDARLQTILADSRAGVVLTTALILSRVCRAHHRRGRL